MEAESTAIVSAYEKRIGELQLEKQIMQEKVASCGQPLKDFDESFRTAETTLPFKALGHFSGGENKMARSGGFEPPTAWFVARYSIQLSYERVGRATIGKGLPAVKVRPG